MRPVWGTGPGDEEVLGEAPPPCVEAKSNDPHTGEDLHSAGKGCRQVGYKQLPNDLQYRHRGLQARA